MKCEFYCVFSIYLISFAGATFVCKDNETNVEYIAEDSDTPMQIKKLSESIDIKMREIKDDLSKQLANLLHVLESKMEHLNKKCENVPHQKHLEPVNQHQREQQSERTLEIGKKPTNCKEAMNNNHQHKSGIYEIQLNAVSSKPFEVFCDNGKHGGNWTVVMRRFDGSVDFNRSWIEYKNGFGKLTGEFFIGMDKLHAMTNSGPKQELLIEMKTAENITKYAKYPRFAVDSESESYKLIQKLDYDGNAANELPDYLDMKFTTADVDNDLWANGNCAKLYNGPWWFRDCGVTSLFRKKMKWYPDFLEFAEMLLRPVN